MAYHSKRSKVYHTLNNCPVGKAIKKKNRLMGTGGKKMCNFCKTAGKVKVGKKKTVKKKKAKKAKRRRR